MKKKIICVLVLSLALSFTLAGCGFNNDRNSDEVLTETTDTDGMVHLESADEVSAFFDEVYDGVGTQNLPNSLSTMELDLNDAELVAYQTGISDVSQIAGITISEPMISSIAYSAVYVRTVDGADVNSIAQEMMDNIDPAKWICVTAEKQMVASIGSDIFYIMGSSETVNAVLEQVKTYAAEKNATVTVLNEKTNS